MYIAALLCQCEAANALRAKLLLLPLLSVLLHNVHSQQSGKVLESGFSGLMEKRMEIWRISNGETGSGEIALKPGTSILHIPMSPASDDMRARSKDGNVGFQAFPWKNDICK